MKVKIIQTYIDKDTRQQVPVGEILNLSDERAKELIGKGKAEQVYQKEEKISSATKELKQEFLTKSKGFIESIKDKFK